MSKFGVSHTVRLYDSNLLDKLANSFENSGHKSKSRFLVELLEKGLVNSRNSGIIDEQQKSDNLGNITSSSFAYQQYLLGKSFDKIANQLTKVEVAQEIGLQILSSIYNMCEWGVDSDMSMDLLEEGFYDKLPERFAKLLQKRDYDNTE